MIPVLRYLATLPAGKIALWCYLIWYLVSIATHFDPSPGLWLNALGISAVVGIALQLSVERGPSLPASRWQTVRLFLMPFCVSSFAATIKGQPYVLIFPSRPLDLLLSAGSCGLFVAVVLVLRRFRRPGRA